MGHLRSISILALGIAASGCAIMFDDPGDSIDPPAPPPSPPPDHETPQFLPQLCTAGLPGSALCPVNQVDLSDLGAVGTFEFVVQALGSGLYFNQLELRGGPEGIYFERPILRAWTSGSLSGELSLGPTQNIPPGMSATLHGETAVLLSTAGVTALSLRFDAIGPYRP